MSAFHPGQRQLVVDHSSRTRLDRQAGASTTTIVQVSIWCYSLACTKQYDIDAILRLNPTYVSKQGQDTNTRHHCLIHHCNDVLTGVSVRDKNVINSIRTEIPTVGAVGTAAGACHDE